MSVENLIGIRSAKYPSGEPGEPCFVDPAHVYAIMGCDTTSKPTSYIHYGVDIPGWRPTSHLVCGAPEEVRGRLVCRTSGGATQ